MGDVTLMIYRSPADRNPFLFDAIVSPVLSRSVDISRYPRESGTDAVDHARILPASYRFTGLLVNEPVDDDVSNRRKNATTVPETITVIGPYDAIIGRDFRDPLAPTRHLGPQVDSSRATRLYLDLIDLMEAREPVRVASETFVLPYALIVSLEQRFTGATGLEISGTIEQVQFATTAEVSLKPVPAPARKKKAGANENGGVKGKTEAPAADKVRAQSLLLKAAQGLGVL